MNAAFGLRFDAAFFFAGAWLPSSRQDVS